MTPLLAQAAPPDGRPLALLLAVAAVVVAAVALVGGSRSRRRGSAAHRLLERRLDLALDAGAMTAWIWDAATDQLSWDARGPGVYGRPAPATLDAWIDLIHPDDRDDIRHVVQRSIGAGDRFQAVHRAIDPDGELRWLELRGEPVLDEAGELLGTAGVVVDVSAERSAAAELEESRQALEQILELAPGLVAEDRPADAPARICRAAVAVFGCDACSIWSVDGAEVRPVVSHPEEVGPTAGTPTALDEVPLLRAQLQRRVPAYVSAGGAGDAAVQTLLLTAGMRAAIVVPLGSGHGVSLFLTLWWRDEPDPPGLARLAVIRRFADQAALALEQARTRAARDEVDALSQSLQAGLLPAPLVRDPGIRVDARYRPGEQRILLGGDFYDVVERSDGQLAFVVGDVTGHGPRPAALGAALRAAWRGLVLAGDDPGSWLHGLGATLASYEMGPEMLVTTVTGTISTDRTAATVASAGHPSPILLSGRAQPLDVPPGIALGLAAPGEGVTTTRLPLRDRWRLLLYTDGAIEIRTGRRSDDRLGMEGLCEWLDAHAADDDRALLDGLLAHLERINVDPLADDIAVVLIGPA